MTDEREVIKTGGPPKHQEDKPITIALAELFRRLDVANEEIKDIRVKAKELRDRTEGGE